MTLRLVQSDTQLNMSLGDLAASCDSAACQCARDKLDVSAAAYISFTINTVFTSCKFFFVNRER